MKKTNNNEMDLALRSLAKSERAGTSFADGLSRGELSGDHLDADELNSYAEGLVPEVARARFTEHLADCSSCRGILVSLTPSAGPVRLGPMTAPERGLRFWEKLSGFLSLPVLRYGVPALAFTAIIAIALLALRQEKSPGFVAQNQPEPASNALPTQLPQTQKSQQPSATTVTESYSRPTPESGQLQAPPKQDLLGARPQTEVSPGAATSSVKPFMKDSPDAAPPPAPASVARAEPVFSEAPKVGGLSRVLSNEAQKAADKKEQADSVNQERQRDATFEARKDAEEDNNAFSSNRPSGPRRAEGLMGERGGYGRKNKRNDTDEAETRTVAGRRFRREGSSWIDAAYSSQATINVKRSSEQFRALIADEPEIRTIANTLGGDIILVWKGKAYRIR